MPLRHFGSLAMFPRGQTLPDEQFRSRHGWMVIALWAHVAAYPFLGLAYGYGAGHALLEGLVIAPWALAARLHKGSRRTRALLVAFGLLTASATLVHITNGLVEAHFHFFVAVAALSLYEDWAVYGLAMGYVLIHHGAAPDLLGEDVYDHGGESSWKWAGVHALFIGGLSVVNVVVWRAAERNRAELARSNEDLEHFASVASHDLREPLRVMTSYLKLLERRELDASADQYVGNALQQSVRMQRLIDALLAYSRVDAAQPVEPVDTRATVDETLRALATTLEAAGARVEVADLPVVRGDALQLGQLFQNLISNAVKFHNGAPPHVRLSAQRERSGWVFTVSDNGIGIEPERADRIFDMFTRLHSDGDFDGTGLGLAICRRIVERHGGSIWVEPNQDGGSCFVFTMPA